MIPTCGEYLPEPEFSVSRFSYETSTFVTGESLWRPDLNRKKKKKIINPFQTTPFGGPKYKNYHFRKLQSQEMGVLRGGAVCCLRAIARATLQVLHDSRHRRPEWPKMWYPRPGMVNPTVVDSRWPTAGLPQLQRQSRSPQRPLLQCTPQSQSQRTPQLQSQHPLQPQPQWPRQPQSQCPRQPSPRSGPTAPSPGPRRRWPRRRPTGWTPGWRPRT